jgi:hypothetical protein
MIGRPWLVARSDPNGKQISNSRYVGPMPTLDFPTLQNPTIAVLH